MAEDGETYQCRCLPMSGGVPGRPGIVERRSRNSPGKPGHQTVRDRIVEKLEGRPGSEVGDDPGVLPSEEQKDSLEEVGELHRDEERTERELRFGTFQSEGDAIMA
jgi:hypothetical protein